VQLKVSTNGSTPDTLAASEGKRSTCHGCTKAPWCDDELSEGINLLALPPQSRAGSQRRPTCGLQWPT
jgi:hypothetical protein